MMWSTRYESRETTDNGPRLKSSHCKDMGHATLLVTVSGPVGASRGISSTFES